MSNDTAPLKPAVPRPGALRSCQSCAIRSMSVCGALRVGELQRLEMIRKSVKLDTRETLFYEGDPASDLFNVTHGAIKVYKLLADGRRQITGFLFPGDFLGLALHNRYTYSAEAITQSELCRFPRGAFEKFLDEFPALERRLLQSASNELAAAQDQMLLLGRKTAKERIATFLLSLSEREVRRGEKHSVAELPMSRNDIGDYLGLTVETVSRTFTRLKKSGLIELQSAHHVVLSDPDALMEIAGIETDEMYAAEAAGF